MQKNNHEMVKDGYYLFDKILGILSNCGNNITDIVSIRLKELWSY